MDRKKILFAASAVAVAGYLLVHAGRWQATVHAHEERFGPARPGEAAAAESDSGIFLDNDSLYWIAYAREMAATGAWRIRHTHVDNPPDGRPVHWSQAISWLLMLLGAIRHMFTDEGLHAAIEHAAVWAGPIQHIIFIAATGYLIFRRLGLALALVWMLNLAAMPSIEWSFCSLRPDHHGLQLALVVSSLLCLILGGFGWTAAAPNPSAPALFAPFSLPDARSARRYFIASGILGGLGFWVGATVQLFGVGLFACGAVALFLLLPRHFAEGGKGVSYQPGLWRTWATTGAAASLVFYLVEYAPNFPGMRLEVNHPLYALSWFCAGGFLVRFAGHSLARSHTWKSTAVLGLWLAAAAMLPLLLAFGPVEWHAYRDLVQHRLTATVDECAPFARYAQGRFLAVLLKEVGLIPIFLVLAAYGADRKALLHEWTTLWTALLAAFAYGALTLAQVRWLNFFAAAGLLLAVFTIVVMWRSGTRPARGRAWAFALAAALILQSLVFARAEHRKFQNLANPSRVDPYLVRRILERQLADKLGALENSGSFLILCDPDLAARLHYHGGVPSVASYYWENLKALKTATAFFAATDFDEARRAIEGKGITHVLLAPGPGTPAKFQQLARGSISRREAWASVAGQLISHPNQTPSWIRRSPSLERDLQPGFLLNHQMPIAGNYLLFVIREEAGR